MKKLTALFIIGLFISCTSDSENATADVVMTGYKIDMNTSPGYHFITIGNLVNNKLFSETHESIINGISQGTTTQQNYFYSNNLLEHYISGDRTTYFYYDSASNLIGATGLFTNGSEIYYRFVNQPNNIVFCERLDLPYNNTAATIGHRCILQFDSNNEVVSAGYDFNLDGVMDNANSFVYTNDNLMSIAYYDGSSASFEYTAIIDSMNVLRENSVGKKVARLICSETFCGFHYDLKYSKNILVPDSFLANYQVTPDNFYELKTEVNGSSTTTTQFFFQ